MNSNFYGNNGFNNDVGFGKAVEFDNNIGIRRNDGIDSSIEYLDLFYNDCINNQEQHNAIKKMKRKWINIQSVWSVLIPMGIIITLFLFNTPFRRLGIGVFIASVFVLSLISFFKWKGTKREYQENIHYGYLSNYLCRENLKKFASGEPRCLTQIGKFQEDSKIDKKFILPAVPVMVIGLLIAFIKVGNAWDEICACLVSSLIACIGIGVISFCITKCLRIKGYDEIVNAVCVEVNRKRSYSTNHKQTTYQPVFFAKCQNGHKYLLFRNYTTYMHVPSVGDVIQLKVNSKNPFEWMYNNYSGYLLPFLFGIFLMVMGLQAYIPIIL